MNRMRLTAAATCLVMLLACTWTARPASADVLEQVPTDALVVVKVNHLKTTSDKFAKLANDLGLAAMAGPPMQDPLGFLQQQSNMVNGVNTEGDLAFVFLDPEKVGGDEDDSWLILVPTSDYQAFLGNFPEAQTEGAVSQIQLGGTPEPQFSANWGAYAAISPTRDLVANKPQNLGISFPAATARELGAKDAVLVANFKALGPMLLPKLKENREEILTDIEKNMANDPDAAKYTPVARAVVGQILDLAETFLTDTQAATLGISLSDEGILTTVIADFAPDTYFGNIMADAKNTGDDKLAGLPAGKYLFFGGTTGDPEAAAKVLDDIAQPILKEVVAMGPEFKAAQDYYDGLRMYVAGSTGSSLGLRAPSGALGQEALIQGINIQRGDAEQMMQGYKKMMNAQQELMGAFGVPAEQMKVTWTEDAKTVEGVQFDVMTSEFNLDPADPSAAQAKQFMDFMYGPGGATVNLGVVDGKLVQAMGLNDEGLAEVVTATRGGLSPLSDLPGVKSVSANLPKQNLALFYVPVDEIVNTGLNFARTFNMPIQVQLPPDLPPVGAAVSTEGPAIKFDMYVPSQLVQSLVAAGMQAAMQMQGGPGGGGGGL